MVAFMPALAFTGSLPLALLGVVAWALVSGVQDSTINSLGADIVPAARLATAHGSSRRLPRALGTTSGFLAGYLLDRSVPIGRGRGRSEGRCGRLLWTTRR